jgi:hypothetical protein
METAKPGVEAVGIVYQPLREECKEIRLLDVKPARRLDEPLRATIRHVKLHEAEYTALSYVWGQQDDDRSDIAIKYKTGTRQYLASKLPGNSGSPTYTHEIGSSLANALRHLRQKYRKITIWTDALCINQTDEQEKSWHIGLMRSVYTEAEEVHAWLGPRYNDDVGLVGHVNAAFDLANTVWALAKRITDPKSLLAEKDWLEACFEVASPQQSTPRSAVRPLSAERTIIRRITFEERLLCENVDPARDGQGAQTDLPSWASAHVTPAYPACSRSSTFFAEISGWPSNRRATQWLGYSFPRLHHGSHNLCTKTVSLRRTGSSIL